MLLREKYKRMGFGTAGLRYKLLPALGIFSLVLRLLLAPGTPL